MEVSAELAALLHDLRAQLDLTAWSPVVPGVATSEDAHEPSHWCLQVSFLRFAVSSPRSAVLHMLRRTREALQLLQLQACLDQDEWRRLVEDHCGIGTNAPRRLRPRVCFTFDPEGYDSSVPARRYLEEMARYFFVTLQNDESLLSERYHTLKAGLLVQIQCLPEAAERLAQGERQTFKLVLGSQGWHMMWRRERVEQEFLQHLIRFAAIVRESRQPAYGARGRTPETLVVGAVDLRLHSWRDMQSPSVRSLGTLLQMTLPLDCLFLSPRSSGEESDENDALVRMALSSESALSYQYGPRRLSLNFEHADAGVVMSWCRGMASCTRLKSLHVDSLPSSDMQFETRQHCLAWLAWALYHAAHNGQLEHFAVEMALTVDDVDTLRTHYHAQEPALTETLKLLPTHRGEDHSATLPVGVKQLSVTLKESSLYDDGAASCLPGCIALLRVIGPAVKSLRLDGSMTDVVTASELDAILNACPRLEELELVTVTVRSLDPLTSNASTHHIHRLVLRRVDISAFVLDNLLNALRQWDCPLTNSLRVLDVRATERVELTQQSVESFLDMLDTNKHLLHLRLDVTSQFAAFQDRFLAHRRQRIETVGLACVVAFLSVASSSATGQRVNYVVPRCLPSLPVNPIRHILAFAAERRTRDVEFVIGSSSFGYYPY